MTEIEIRRAGANDWEAIWPIFREVVVRGDTYAYPVDTSEADARALWLEKPAATYVAVRGREIVGTYYLKPNQPGQGSHVCNAGYMVGSAARGLGAGRSMCAHSLTEAKRLGFSAMQYNLVVSTNVRAVAIWRAHGFEVIGTLPKAFSHPEQGLVDALVMHRLLDD